MVTSKIEQTADLRLLQRLDLKLHYTQKGKYCGKDCVRDAYTDKSMDGEEIEAVLRVLDRNDFTIYPINTNFNLSVGFEISDIVEGKIEPLLTFMEKQLPSGYDFNKLSEYFMKKDNIKRAESANRDIRIINQRSHYEY